MKYRLGIVLSGGGVRGVAHAGVLKALDEHGIQPDCIAGSSSGALVGGLYAAGYGPEEVLDFFVRKNPFRMSNLAVGKPGWIDTAKVGVDFAEYFPRDDFDCLNKKLFIAATDLLAGEPVIIDSGSLITAILASCSIPMVFTPTTFEGRWLADGGITNNFPVEPLGELCERIVGVYASPIRSADETSLGSSVAVWQRSFEIGMYYFARRKFDQCSLVISPEALSRYGMFGTKHVETIFKIGYEAALAQIKSIESAGS